MECSRDACKTILERCDQLALISEERGRITRSYLSSSMEQATALVAKMMVAAGLETERDHAGNLIGTLSSDRLDAPVLVLGSHLDTVRNAGRYDGVLGVLLALAASESFAQSNLPFDLEVVAFADEEGLRFGQPFLGSKALIGELGGDLLACCDGEGQPLAEVIRQWGGEPDSICYRYRGRRTLGYLEAHIEQGPELESRQLPLGVLACISGSRWLRLCFVGRAGHAGTTPMKLRRDPLSGAAEWVLEVERLAREQSSMVATVGKLEVSPGAGNVIPGQVEVSLDIRHGDNAVLDRAVSELLHRARQICAHRQLEVSHEMLSNQPGAGADERLSGLLADAVRATGTTPARMVIGAGHDAMIMAAKMPMTMLMMRSPGGISHHPDEAVVPGDVELALASLRSFIEHLAQAESDSEPRFEPPAAGSIHSLGLDP